MRKVIVTHEYVVPIRDLFPLSNVFYNTLNYKII